MNNRSTRFHIIFRIINILNKSLHDIDELNKVNLINQIYRHRLFGENKTKNNLIECSSIKSNEFNGGELVVFGTGDKYGDIELVDEYTINLESIIKDRYIFS